MRIRSLNTISLARLSKASIPILKAIKILYNKSKKRIRIKVIDKLNKDTPKKIDLRTIILGLLKELGLIRKTKELY